MAVTQADFNRIWASASPLTPYSFSDANYKKGWNFVGPTPPARQMWDKYMNLADQKMQYLYNNYLPLAGGTLTGNNAKITMSNGESYIRCWGNGLYLGGTDESNSSTLTLFTNSNAGGFQINAGDGTTSKRMVGKPDGTLTWNGQPLLPVGVVQAFAGTTIPNGWLLCDGSAINRVTYAGLFNVIGTTYGKGDGSTTFNLPNLTDKFIQGSATAGTVKSAGLPNITGSVSAAGAVAWQDPKGAMYFSGGLSANPNGYSGSNQVTLEFSASRSNSIYGNSTTVQPPALTMRYIIKY